jgi:hypothetical protein|tara:strand:+ start:291 stop:461 length:171 start_codon:yes stop_codon:yes gene_type:complete
MGGVIVGHDEENIWFLSKNGTEENEEKAMDKKGGLHGFLKRSTVVFLVSGEKGMLE